MSDVVVTEQSEETHKIHVDPKEYQKLVAGYEHSEKIRKKSLEIAKMQAVYDKAKDASLKAKKTLDEGHRELQELGAELDDPQQRLPLEVDNSKDPKKRKPAEKRPQDHEKNGKAPAAKKPEAVETKETEDVADAPVPTAADLETDWSIVEIGTLGDDKEPILGVPKGMIGSLEANEIKTFGDVFALHRGEHEKYPNGPKDLGGWGPGKAAKLSKAVEAFIESHSIVFDEPAEESEVVDEATDEETDSETGEPAELSEPVGEPVTESHLVKIRIKDPSESLIDQGLTNGKVVEGKQNGKTVVVMASPNTPVTIIPKYFDIVAS